MNLVRYLLVISTIAFTYTNVKAQNTKIIGGEYTNRTANPHVVSLENETSLLCGGAIINRKFVLTAAQCVYYLRDLPLIPVSALKVRVGSEYSLSGGEVFRVEEVIPHEDFFQNREYRGEFHADIALVKLFKNIEFSETVQPVSISLRMPVDGELAYVAGYGNVELEGTDVTTTVSPFSTGTQLGQHLAGTQVPIMSHYECIKLLKGVSIDTICAGSDAGDRNPCVGDKGDPLMLDGKMVGLMSWNAGCLTPGQPSVYTNVILYEAWVTEKSCLCSGKQ